jgi:hypothetical protein
MDSVGFFDASECDVTIVQPQLGRQPVPEAMQKKELSTKQECDVLLRMIFVERCRHGIIPLTHVHFAAAEG